VILKGGESICLDPVFICEKTAYTVSNKVIDIKNLLASTIGFESIGCVQNRDKYGKRYSRSFYK